VEILKKFKVGLVRVVTLSDQDLLNLHGRIIEDKFPQLEVTSKCIPNQPYGIHDDETELMAVPKILNLAKEWDDIDALIISCAGDPALKELKEVLSIPVIGAGESTAMLAMRYGKPYGVLGITEEAPVAYKNMFGENIVGTCKIDGITSTLDLMTDEGKEKVIRKAVELKEVGAEVIALACTGLATIGIARELERITGIPIIDPVLSEGAVTLFECIRKP
jgi:Asp/Glu/hydantoin racemase